MGALENGRTVGALVGFVIAFILIKVCNTNKKTKTEWDERQQLERGKAYKYGFIVAVAYMFLQGLVPLDTLPYMNNMMVSLIGGFIAIAVFSVISIWKDANFGMNSDVKKYTVLYVVLGLFNGVIGIMAAVAGHIVEDGELQFPFINLGIGVLFLLIGIELVVKHNLNKAEEE